MNLEPIVIMKLGDDAEVLRYYVYEWFFICCS